MRHGPDVLKDGGLSMLTRARIAALLAFVAGTLLLGYTVSRTVFKKKRRPHRKGLY